MSLSREQLTTEWVDRITAQLREQGRIEPLSDEQRAASMGATLASLGPGEDVWVFGYGSLMWNPIIHFEEQRLGLLYGYHRRYCFWVEAGRGSPEMPGLMLALDRGGSCRGMAFRVAAHHREQELRLVWMREMLSGIYSPRWVNLHTAQGVIRAVTFVVNRGHGQYEHGISETRAAHHLARAEGVLGSARSYLENTVAHLADLGVADGYLNRVLRLVEAEQAR